MSDNRWTDRIVAERMTVDQEFSSRVETSMFSRQEWSLVMTATSFEIENPDDPDRARIVANTDSVEHILPELENIRSQTGAMGASPGDGGAGGSGGGGIVNSIKGALGMGGGGGGSYDAEREAAEQLTQEYAEALQSELETNGRWDSIRRTVADADGDDQSPA